MAVAIGEDYVCRALSAWFRGGRSRGEERLYPSETLSQQVILPDGKQYVLLANSSGVLAVYRIRPSGLLRWLRRWPKEVEVAAGWPREEVA